VLNDGFDLGAQRRPVDRNDLVRPKNELDATKVLKAQRTAIDAGKRNPWLIKNNVFAFEVTKKQIAQSSDYNLSAERYRPGSLGEKKSQKWPMVQLQEVCEINPKKGDVSELAPETEVSFVPMADLSENQMVIRAKQTRKLGDVLGSYTYFADGDVLLAKVTPCFENGKAGVVSSLKNAIGFGSSEFIVLRASAKILPQLVYRFISDKSFRELGKAQMSGTGGLQRIPVDFVKKYAIPLPPIEVQKELIEQIRVKQDAIEHAKAIIENLEREREYFGRALRKLENIEWVELGKIGKLEYGFTDTAKEIGDTRFIRITDIGENGNLKNTEQRFIELTRESRKYLLSEGDLLVARTGATYGKTAVFKEHYPSVFASYLIRLRLDKAMMLPDFYWLFAQSADYWKQAKSLMTGGGQQQFNANAIKKIKVPIVPLEIQRQMVVDLEREEGVISANRQLVELMEKKISLILSEV
jgi:type I restriction enzyme M protein